MGSGAFPMSMLQRLVFLLSKLDPDNTKWKAQQVKAIEDNVKDPALKKQRIDEIESNFKDNEPDYVRKFYLIQNCLYGVDIQPIAIQIAKLRFFISLLVDKKVNPDNGNNNYGIKPLPNLETKLVIANTLVGLNKFVDLVIGKQTLRTLRSAKIEDLENQIQEKLSDYFSAYKKKEKEKIKEKYRDLVKELKSFFEIEGFPSNVIEKIIKYDPFDTNTASDWFDPEWMFGIKDGFDIVIGNPPYIQLQKDHGKLADLYKDEGYKVFDRTGDIYCLFYEKGYNLLADKGTLSLISSNKWMRAKYGEKLRRFLKERTILKELVYFGGYKVFDATVDTNIIILEKEKTHDKNEFWYLNVESDFDGKNIAEYFNKKGNVMDQSDLSDSAWTLADDRVLALKKKIEKIGKPLKEWDVKIYRGILTGFNEAFIIDTEKRNEILSNCRDEEERKLTEAIIKPILRGRDIKRYYYEWAGLWVIGTFPALRLNIDDYPAIKKYFLDNFDVRQLEQSGKKYPELGFDARKKTGNKWFETQDQIAYYHEFEKEKVVYSEIVRQPQFYFDKEKFYVEATSFLMTGKNVKYICGLLNSEPVTYFFKQWYAGGGLGKEGYRYKKAFLENLPIPPITLLNQSIVSQIEELVDKILCAKKVNPQADTSEFEKQINYKVYELYGLNYQEMKIIEESI